MPKVTLKRAAELTGRTRSTIHRAMRAGRLSYETDERGTRLIDVSELDRTFGTLPQQAEVTLSRSAAPEMQRHSAQPSTELRVELEVARTKIAMLEHQVLELRHDRDRWAAQAERLLTDQRPPPKRSWWSALFGR